MSPTEVCDVLDFLVEQSWPMSEAETHRLLVQRFGWTIDHQDGRAFLVNSVSGLNEPDVMTGETAGWSAGASFATTDTVRPPTAESKAFLGDQFALLVREGTARWGTPASQTAEEAVWDIRDGAQVVLSLSRAFVNADYSSPQNVALDRRAEELGV